MKLLYNALIATAATSLVATTGNAGAATFEGKDWSLSVNGNINANYTYLDCDEDADPVAGALLCGNTPGGSDTSSSVNSGNLPNALVFGVKTSQGGYDLSATVGYFYGIAGNDFGGTANVPSPGGNIGLASAGEDIRQVFGTFGNDDFGTVKFGRDFSPVGLDAILSDITLITVGVATVFTGTSPANVTLGTIGFGHLYPNPQAAITYITPNRGGLVGSFGIFQPTDVFNLSGTAASSSGASRGTPGFQGKLRYDFKQEGGMSGFVSSAALYQEQELTAPGAGAMLTETNPDSYVIDFTGKLAVGNFEFVGHAYTGTGIGIYTYFFDAFSATGDARDSNGGYIQAAYIAGATKFGINYGISTLDQADGDTDDTLLETNSKITAGVYHSLTKSLTLTAEVTAATAESHAGGEVETTNFNVGFFFGF